MYAVIRTGGKQYVVKPGDILKVEKIEAQEGQTVELEVLMLKSDDGSVKLGPELEGHRAKAKVLRHGKGRKVIVFKYKPKKHYQRKYGHRQPFTEIKIETV